MSTWGRRETVVWPPQQPVWTWCGFLVGVVSLFLLCSEHVYYAKPLQRLYLGTYAKSAIFAAVGHHSEHRLIYVAAPSLDRREKSGRSSLRPALDLDVEEGYTASSGGLLPVQLSAMGQAERLSALFLGPLQRYDSRVFVAWMRAAIYGGQTPFAFFAVPLMEGLPILLLACLVGGYYDVARRKRMKYGRLLKGPVMLSPKEFNRALASDGMGIRTSEKTILRVPRIAEPKHMQIMGDTGAGKSTLINQMLQQIEDRGDVAIVYDPAGEFIQRFYDEDRGDQVLNPLDARCPYWSPAAELTNAAEARTIAASLYQPTSDRKGEFFTETPQKIFAHLLRYQPSPQQLVAWMSDPSEIDRRVAGTELASILASGAQQQRNGVLASLGLIADSLRLLPTREQSQASWSATGWAKDRKGWLFLTSSEAEQEALRPLHSLWIDLLILRLLTAPEPDKRPAWLVIDELASLQRLPQLHTALTKGRKSGNPIIFGYQGKAQLEVIYGHLAEVMLSQPATKWVLKTAEPHAAKWASDLIGQIEVERLRETISTARTRGKSFTLDTHVEPLVMASEIAGLSDLHAFVKLENYVSRFSFPHMSLPPKAPAFVDRPQQEQAPLWLREPAKAQEKATAEPEGEPHSAQPVFTNKKAL